MEYLFNFTCEKKNTSSFILYFFFYLLVLNNVFCTAAILITEKKRKKTEWRQIWFSLLEPYVIITRLYFFLLIHRLLIIIKELCRMQTLNNRWRRFLLFIEKKLFFYQGIIDVSKCFRRLINILCFVCPKKKIFFLAT